ncbi:hypothetical protein NVP1152O_076 [Vibrio phage 1.152.O._10N.222.46.E1]|uniref:Uncharacterized protein n=5 Tax=Nahantvirus 49C7 TaxID=2846601 RepID=A0A2I7RBH9_9CAUD|nr:hypothetical protein HYP57_gp075 [Vibrio phage 1.026.O._10N.222.49.C7]AUR82558.1 hypothetical protein NVP1025O_075 [Vibrio phage 1.025.O._10N.222.46.B6]AUR90808.1 hypothetical protein NVP1150O_075 [Vibrio phage 1.150.O._10N.222.46.A6]AUR90981.1 hypothetical protein NVP1152O_076 [Vibrio phage 1.152.O._10N.222.46.E1]AUS02449.1 hypothetical protein NVP2130O_075 [Vibrio phage 2.130.O._10N.222.46.C2]AUR82666.1 hypothetical protein NVP1026O_075 [Vibrio phage 1.026.O._10N.222.49.C7]
MTTHKLTVEVDTSLFTLSDKTGLCIANDEGVEFELDTDNDILITCKNHYFIEKEDFDLLERARGLSEDEWDCIKLNQLLEDE